MCLFCGMQLLTHARLRSHILRLGFPICGAGDDITRTIGASAKSEECLRHQKLVAGADKFRSGGCGKVVCVFAFFQRGSDDTQPLAAPAQIHQSAADLQANIIWLGLVLLKATQTRYRSYQRPAWLTTITLNGNLQATMHPHRKVFSSVVSGSIKRLLDFFQDLQIIRA